MGSDMRGSFAVAGCGQVFQWFHKGSDKRIGDIFARIVEVGMKPLLSVVL